MKIKKKNLTELVFILDRSGSMSGLEDDTIGGFNAMLKKQQALAGDALVSTVLFNNQSAVIHNRVDVRRVAPLTRAQYWVGGSTALLDAVGQAIEHIGNVHKYAFREGLDIPEHTLFVITTDGMENASRLYSVAQVRQLIERQKAKYGWEFMFLGANIDAVQAAGSIGICPDRAVSYHSDHIGTQLNYQAIGDAVCSMRRNAAIPRDWAAPISRDYTNRK